MIYKKQFILAAGLSLAFILIVGIFWNTVEAGFTKNPNLNPLSSTKYLVVTFITDKGNHIYLHGWHPIPTKRCEEAKQDIEEVLANHPLSKGIKGYLITCRVSLE